MTPSSGAAEGSAVSSGATGNRSAGEKGAAKVMHDFDALDLLGDMLTWKTEVGGRLGALSDRQDVFEEKLSKFPQVSPSLWTTASCPISFLGLVGVCRGKIGWRRRP